jgi:hypothetical protein
MRLPEREKPQVKRQDIQPVPEVHRQKEPDPPAPGLQENGNYRYYSTQRPVDLGSFPKPQDNPVVEIHNYDADSRVPVENGMIQAWGYVEYGMIQAWGYVEYQKPLTKHQLATTPGAYIVFYHDFFRRSLLFCLLFG